MDWHQAREVVGFTKVYTLAVESPTYLATPLLLNGFWSTWVKEVAVQPTSRVYGPWYPILPPLAVS